VDDDRLLTFGDGVLTLWIVPECRAVWERPIEVWRRPVLSPGRQYILVDNGRKVRLISTQDGHSAGVVDVPEKAGWISGAGFAPDGSRLAVTTWLPGSSTVIIVDCATGMSDPPFHVQAPGQVVRWVADDYLLLNGIYLASLSEKAVAWKYRLTSGTHIDDAPPGLHWFLTTSQSSGSILCAAGLPDEDAKTTLATESPVPDVVLGPGERACLVIEPVRGLRRELADRVRDAYTEQFALNEITVDDSADVRVVFRGSYAETGESGAPRLNRSMRLKSPSRCQSVEARYWCGVGRKQPRTLAGTSASAGKWLQGASLAN